MGFLPKEKVFKTRRERAVADKKKEKMTPNLSKESIEVFPS
jgi:hypothetical protein